jgi:hypothetical protein
MVVDWTEFVVIGDIAGQYSALQNLLKKVPQKIPVIGVGDFNDRGPQSKEVYSWFMGNGYGIQSNHGHMMVDCFEGGRFYDPGIWFWNGGDATIRSFTQDKRILSDLDQTMQLILENNKEKNQYIFESCNHIAQSSIPNHVIEYEKSLPKFIETPDCIITHAPINPSILWERFLDFGDHASDRKCGTCYMWNRGQTSRRGGKGKLQIHGHTSYRNPTFEKDKQGYYAICVDTSKARKLTAIHYPSLETFEAEYED